VDSDRHVKAAHEGDQESHRPSIIAGFTALRNVIKKRLEKLDNNTRIFYD
jgi:hypothetical protein